MEDGMEDGKAARAKLVEAYRAMEPVAQLINYMKEASGPEDRWLSLEFQDDVMETVVGDQVCDRFPPQQQYTYRFLKTYMAAIEAAGVEASDAIVSGLMEFMLNSGRTQDALATDDMHHVSFTVGTDAVITCRVATVFNDVGLKLWEAGWFLAEYLVSHAEEFRGKRVLELGAGVGFSGMALAAVGAPSHIVLTDYAPNVMQNLRYNVEINTDKFACPVTVQALDWDAWDPANDPSERPDVLLAGDCVYDVAAFPSLVRVLNAFLSNEAGDDKLPRTAVFASTIRNRTTFQAFLDQLHAHGIVYVDVTDAALITMGDQRYRYDNRDQIRLCELTRAGSE